MVFTYLTFKMGVPFDLNNFPYCLQKWINCNIKTKLVGWSERKEMKREEGKESEIEG